MAVIVKDKHTASVYIAVFSEVCSSDMNLVPWFPAVYTRSYFSMAFYARRDVSHDAQSAMLLAMVNSHDLALVLH